MFDVILFCFFQHIFGIIRYEFRYEFPIECCNTISSATAREREKEKWHVSMGKWCDSVESLHLSVNIVLGLVNWGGFCHLAWISKRNASILINYNTTKVTWNAICIYVSKVEFPKFQLRLSENFLLFEWHWRRQRHWWNERQMAL